MQKSQPPQSSQKEIASRLSLQIKVGAAVGLWLKWPSRSKNRFFRFTQLVTTEKDYHSDLLTIRDYIKKPLRDSSLITENEQKKMFANIQSMIALSEQMYQQLSAKLATWDKHTTLIGDTMKKYAKFMLFYSDYFKNLHSTQMLLQSLLKQNPAVQQIQKRLSSPERIVTFEDLMSKPFQRPLKYHLILRDYASKIPKNHPDAPFLKEAIDQYHKVNQQNNAEIENKEKNQKLIELDKKFGSIIKEGEGPRTYLAQFQAIMIDTEVMLYIFSDILLIDFKDKKREKELRIHLDRWSYLERPSDGNYFVNRIFVYGKRVCVHLSFLDRASCIECEEVLLRTILSIQANEVTRQERLKQEERNTIEYGLQRMLSLTQSKPQMRKPLVVSVIGNDQRCFRQDKQQYYYVLQFHVCPQKAKDVVPPHQIALVTFQTLTALQTLTLNLYPDFSFTPLDHCPKGIKKTHLQKNKDMSFEFRTIFIQLFLNSVLRDPIISKRLDIYAYLLGVSDALWDYVNASTHSQQQCKACFQQQVKYESMADYYHQIKKRFFVKNQSANKLSYSRRQIHFCDKKTLQMRQAIQEMPAATIANGLLLQRLEWLKSKFGWINHILTHPKPASTRLSAKIYFCDVSNTRDPKNVQFNTSQKVSKIKSYLSQILKTNLQDYALVAVMGPQSYLLFQDESLGSILARPKEQMGFFSGWFSKDPYPIEIWLKKVWFMQPQLQIKCQERKLQLMAEELIFRIKQGEIKLRDLSHYSYVYACYYCYKHFIELDTLTYYLIKKRTEELDRILPDRMREKIVNTLYWQIDKIKQNKEIKNEIQLARDIVYSVLSCPGGSCYFFNAQLRPDGIMIKIGCDYQSIKVRQRSNMLFEFKFSPLKRIELGINGYELTLMADKQYVFYSKDMWKFKLLAEMHYFYYQQFCAQNK